MIRRVLIIPIFLSGAFISADYIDAKKMVKQKELQYTNCFERLNPELQAGVVLLISGILMKVCVKSLDLLLNQHDAF